jgi:micrococcal nuclease
MYEYSAKVLRVIDADTIEVSIDLGFDVWITQHVRLIGINTAEKNTDFGKLSKSYVENTLPKDTVVILQSQKNEKEKYGRYLARVLFPESRQCLNDMLIAMGYASEYWGKGPKVVPSALN